MMKKLFSRELAINQDQLKAENQLFLDQLSSYFQESAEVEELLFWRPLLLEIFWLLDPMLSMEFLSEELILLTWLLLLQKSPLMESTSMLMMLSLKALEDTPRMSWKMLPSIDWKKLRLETNKTANGELSSRTSKRQLTENCSSTSRKLSIWEDIWEQDLQFPTPPDLTISNSDWIYLNFESNTMNRVK